MGEKRRIGVGVLFIALILFFAGSTSYAKEKTVVVAVLDYPNYITIQENGKPYGYAVEYLEEIAEYTGWTYEYKPMSLKAAIDGVKNGSVDILAGVQHSQSIAKDGCYTRENMGYGGTILCCSAGKENYAYNDFSGFDGMRIGALDSSIRVEQFKNFIKPYGVEIEIIKYNSDQAAKSALKKGEVDTLLMSSIRCEEGNRIVAQIDNEPLYFLCNPFDKSIKQGIDKAQQKIHLIEPYHEQILQEKYYENVLTSLAYTIDEKKFIYDAETVRVALCKNWPPYSSYDSKTKQFSGIIVDIFNMITLESGVRFEYIGYDNLKTMSKAVKNAEADVLSAIAEERNWGRSKNVKVTQDYISAAMVTLYQSIPENKKRLALVKGIYSTENMKNSEEDYLIQSYDTALECVEAVRTNRADYAMVSTYEADYFLEQPKYHSINFRTQSNYQQKFAMGVSKSAPVELLSILKKSLNRISEAEMKAMIRSNTDTLDHYTLMDMIYVNPVGTFLSMMLLLLGLLIIFVLWERNYVNQKRNEVLQKADLAKTAFLSHMSHEMRTPLNGINGILNILKEKKEFQEDDYIDKALLSTRHLTTLINNVLDMSKIESGKLEISNELVSLVHMEGNIEAIIQPLAKQKNIHFLIDNSAVIHKGIYTDEQRMQQIIINVLSNAVKYTNQGGTVQFILKEKERREEYGQLEVTISDTGIGMSKEFCSHAFDPFSQAEKGFSSYGTGLGLAITKELVEKMDGKISLESQEGVGTTIIIRWKAKFTDEVLEADNQQTGTPLYFRGKRALVVEDNEINMEITKVQLNSMGIQIQQAENGQEAVDLFAASTEGSFDVIFMDIMMPLKNGLEATKEIRAMDRRDAKSVPIVAMTANAFAEDVNRSLESGMNFHLSKPFDKVKIQQILIELFGIQNSL